MPRKIKTRGIRRRQRKDTTILYKKGKSKKTARLFSEFEEGKFRVTIFGSARAKRGNKEYKQAYLLAKLLGQEGIEIVTGGGPGIMEAASTGHKKGRKKFKGKKKVHSIGLNIKLPFEQKANKAVDISKEYSHFSERLDNFMLLSNVIVVAPGGVGTLLELFYTWQLVQVKHICNIPIILLGDIWPPLIKWLEKSPLKKNFINKEDLNLLFLAKDCPETIKMIKKANEEYKKGDKNFCLNYKRYKLY